MGNIILLDKPQEVIDRYKPQYQPAPHKPEWFDKAVTQIGGLNTFGEPNLRVVWGMDAKIFRCGNPHAIKYLGTNSRELGRPAWMLEEWWSPQRLGTPEDWESNRYYFDEEGKKQDLIGEYPSRGMYWLFQALVNEEGLPSQLTESTLEYIRLIFTNRLQPQQATDNARRYREMLEKQHDLNLKQKIEAEALNNANWEEMLTKWEAGIKSMTRAYSTHPK